MDEHYYGTAPFGTAPFATAPFGTAPFGTAPFGTALVKIRNVDYYYLSRHVFYIYEGSGVRRV